MTSAGAGLVTGVRIVPVGGPHTSASTSTSTAPDAEVIDLRLLDGVVVEAGPRLTSYAGEQVHEGGGRWAIPGLWDGHVHFGQWAQMSSRLDLAGTSGPVECLARVAAYISRLPSDQGRTTVAGWGHRSATWARPPTVAELDAVSAGHPVVLISGDAHHGWLNSTALRLLGAGERVGPVDEAEWFSLFHRLGELPGVSDQGERGYVGVLAEAAGRGVVGLIDMEMAPNWLEWPARVARGLDTMRVRCAAYPSALGEVVGLGLRSGDPLGPGGLVEMGPLKIISDGSLNTRTAYCCEPYADASVSEHPRGTQNVAPEELRRLLGEARDHGLTVALHAIGDAAVADALDAFEATGATGAIEHAQLMRVQDLGRMGRLGIVASVQPAHLLDDRDVTSQCWPDRADRCFPFRSLLDAGVALRLGSDAPVSPLDPWLQMAAAVHRSADERPPWGPDQGLTVAEALAASTDGQGSLGVGSRGDIVLLDVDPLEVPSSSKEAAAYLRAIRPAATFVAGRLVHSV